MIFFFLATPLVRPRLQHTAQTLRLSTRIKGDCSDFRYLHGCNFGFCLIFSVRGKRQRTQSRPQLNRSWPLFRLLLFACTILVEHLSHALCLQCAHLIFARGTQDLGKSGPWGRSTEHLAKAAAVAATWPLISGRKRVDERHCFIQRWSRFTQRGGFAASF